MINGALPRDNLERAREALWRIPSDLPRDEWHTIGRAAIAAGLGIDDIDEWSSTASNYAGTKDVISAFRNIKPEGGTGPGTLYMIAAQYGYSHGGKRRQKPTLALARPQDALKPTAQGVSASEVWGRLEPASYQHDYVTLKRAAGVPLDSLRVVPTCDPLRIAGQSMAGALVVPAYAPDGTLQSLQLIPPPGAGKKLNLPGAPMAGASFVVGTVVRDAPVYLCEGIGAAWACWQHTRRAAVVCFGWGNVSRVAAQMRARDASVRLVLVPDSGKESAAALIAGEVGAAVACMPEGEADNFDANDLAIRDGGDVLAALLERAQMPTKPEPRYKLLSGADLAALPPVQWRVRNVLPAVGLAAIYGPSASGKSFLAFDLAAAIAEGAPWFGSRVEPAPVVYCALEGEAGFKLRSQAWEMHRACKLPDKLSLILQPFKLTEPQDVEDLAAVVPAGAVVFVDTLNRAAPTSNENDSKDMGEILSAAKVLQGRINGLVVLVHHTGKDATKGLRGHSSLFAALDAALEVSRDGDHREWCVSKSKDGQDGEVEPFNLKIETLGSDEHGDAITSCVVIPDTAPREVRAKLSGGSNQRLALDALGPLFKAGVAGKPGAPPMRPCITLEAALAMVGSRLITVKEKRRPERAKQAIHGLIAKKLLGFNDGWLWLV